MKRHKAGELNIKDNLNASFISHKKYILTENVPCIRDTDWALWKNGLMFCMTHLVESWKWKDQSEDKWIETLAFKVHKGLKVIHCLSAGARRASNSCSARTERSEICGLAVRGVHFKTQKLQGAPLHYFWSVHVEIVAYYLGNSKRTLGSRPLLGEYVFLL